MSTYADRPWLQLYDGALRKHAVETEGDGLSMFAATVRRTPDEVATRYFDSAWTFQEVDQLGSGLAAALVDRGVERGDRVVVFLQNVPQFLIAMVATWKVGAVLVSANPMLKQRELRHLLEDSGATAIVTLDSLWADVAKDAVDGTAVRVAVTTSELDLLDGHVPSVLAGVERSHPEDTLDLVEVASRPFEGAPPSASFEPDDVALIVYTSGTTGPSKGATITHGNLVFNARTFRDWAGITGDDVLLGVAPLFHVTGLVGHLALSMLTGAQLLLASRFDAATTLAMIERHRPTFVVGSITVFVALMNADGFAERDLSSLRVVLSGGAPVPAAVAERFERQVGAEIRGIYGLTETTSPSHMVPLGRHAPTDPATGALSVGVPVFGTDVRIVDESGAEVAVGEAGEIVIAGPQVVPGYWGSPAEAMSAFGPLGFATGDIGFMDGDGWFYVVDRKKDQINASGYKVWPREVEDVLYEHPSVLEAAVVGLPDEYRGETVKAFVSLVDGERADEAELIAFCRERLAAYKYPRQVEIVDELPKTTTGKILRRALRAGTERCVGVDRGASA